MPGVCGSGFSPPQSWSKTSEDSSEILCRKTTHNEAIVDARPEEQAMSCYSYIWKARSVSRSE
jgi:hypothetical protein